MIEIEQPTNSIGVGTVNYKEFIDLFENPRGVSVISIKEKKTIIAAVIAKTDRSVQK